MHFQSDIAACYLIFSFSRCKRQGPSLSQMLVRSFAKPQSLRMKKRLGLTKDNDKSSRSKWSASRCATHTMDPSHLFCRLNPMKVELCRLVEWSLTVDEWKVNK